MPFNNTRRRNRRRQRARPRRSRRVALDPNCRGKNKPLEDFWGELSSYLSVVIIYKGTRPYEIVKVHHAMPTSEHLYSQLKPFDDDPSVVAILTSHPAAAHNAYETIIYPNAKDKTVDYVITHYDKIFKSVPACMQKMFKNAAPLKKLRAPLMLKCE